MAFADPIVFAYDGANISLNLVSKDHYQAVYFGVGTALTVTMTIKHTIPAIGKDGESHMARVDVAHFDGTTGAYIRTSSAWSVCRTDGLPQDQENSEDVWESIVDFLSDANITKLVTRQS